MKTKTQRIVVKDKKIKRVLKKGEGLVTQKDFIMLLKSAVKPQK